jgi:hypothetical protein
VIQTPFHGLVFCGGAHWWTLAFRVLAVARVVSTARPVTVGCRVGWERGVGGGWGSLVHCWVLRQQIPSCVWCLFAVPGWVWRVGVGCGGVFGVSGLAARVGGLPSRLVGVSVGVGVVWVCCLRIAQWTRASLWLSF